MSTAHTPSRYAFSTPEGYALARQILRKYIPYDPHDYQLEGVCQVLDGHDLLATLATGSGKTSFYTMYMLMLIELSTNPSLCSPPYSIIPKDPAMIAIYPTIGLEEQIVREPCIHSAAIQFSVLPQEAQFKALGVQALVINAHTLEAARHGTGSNLLLQARSGASVIILSPEQLTLKGFEGLIQNNVFHQRICVAGLDEAHTIDTWGAAFRKSYRQVGFARFRMPSRVWIIATSVTVRTGQPKSTICKSLGFRDGEYYELRRSNVQWNIRPIFRILKLGLGGWSFPDLDWLIPDERKTVIFARTIALGFCVLVYLWNKVPMGSNHLHHIRLYNALNWPTYNTHTRELIENDPQCKIVIATSTFMMGVDVPNIHRVIILGEPESTEEWLQWLGRVVRGHNSCGECITYISKNALEHAHEIVKGEACGAPGKKGPASVKKSRHSGQMDPAMVRIILAPCKVAEQDALYDNPFSDPPCLCKTCTMLAVSDVSSPLCTCSGPGHRGCQPEQAETAPASDEDIAGDSHLTALVPKSKRLTKAMHAVGIARFMEFRDSIYLANMSAATDFFTPNVFFPEPAMQLILDHFALLSTVDRLRELLSARVYLLPHIDGLWTVLQQLQVVFSTLRKPRTRVNDHDVEPEAGHETVTLYGSDSTCVVAQWDTKATWYDF